MLQIQSAGLLIRPEGVEVIGINLPLYRLILLLTYRVIQEEILISIFLASLHLLIAHLPLAL